MTAGVISRGAEDGRGCKISYACSDSDDLHKHPASITRAAVYRVRAGGCNQRRDEVRRAARALGITRRAAAPHDWAALWHVCVQPNVYTLENEK